MGGSTQSADMATYTQILSVLATIVTVTIAQGFNDPNAMMDMGAGASAGGMGMPTGTEPTLFGSLGGGLDAGAGMDMGGFGGGAAGYDPALDMGLDPMAGGAAAIPQQTSPPVQPQPQSNPMQMIMRYMLFNQMDLNPLFAMMGMGGGGMGALPLLMMMGGGFF